MRPGYIRRGKGGASNKAGASKEKAKSFEEFYSDLYGKRWLALRSAMLVEPRKIALYNRFCQLPVAEVMAGLKPVRPDSITQAYVVAAESAEGEQGSSPSPPPLIPKPPQDDFQTRGYYIMDYASALVVEQLHVGPFDKVLDLCAAPGGKSIAIAQFLSPDGQLTANESRGDRCARLRRNLHDHVPTNYVPWTVTQRNAETWHDPNTYTRVLVDAPCSSERHLVHQAGGGAVDSTEWQVESSKKLGRLQLSLLQRGIETCATGGRVVYSTCSISPYENDAVVAEALRTTRCDVALVHPSYPIPEPARRLPEDMDGAEDGEANPSAARTVMPPPIGASTTHGWMIFPDASGGWGPIFMAVLYKRGHTRTATSSEEEDEDEDTE